MKQFKYDGLLLSTLLKRVFMVRYNKFNLIKFKYRINAPKIVTDTRQRAIKTINYWSSVSSTRLVMSEICSIPLTIIEYSTSSIGHNLAAF